MMEEGITCRKCGRDLTGKGHVRNETFTGDDVWYECMAGAGCNSPDNESLAAIAIEHLSRGCDDVTPVERRAICQWAAAEITDLRRQLDEARERLRGFLEDAEKYATHVACCSCSSHVAVKRAWIYVDRARAALEDEARDFRDREHQDKRTQTDACKSEADRHQKRLRVLLVELFWSSWEIWTMHGQQGRGMYARWLDAMIATADDVEHSDRAMLLQRRDKAQAEARAALEADADG